MGILEATMIIVAILIPLGFAVLCAKIAKSRGRDPILYGILGFFFSVLVLTLLLIFPERQDGIHEKQREGLY